jgi:acyl-CoA hydrolase
MDRLAPKPPRDSAVEMTQLVLPTDTNVLGAAFGGRVMEWIDLCGAATALRHCRKQVVTASMDELHFHAPIKMGWIVRLRGRVLAAFRTSLEVGIAVTAEEPLTGTRHLTTTALLTYVALEPDGSRSPVPALLPETEDEKKAAEDAQLRRDSRLNRKGASVSWQKLFE